MTFNKSILLMNNIDSLMFKNLKSFGSNKSHKQVLTGLFIAVLIISVFSVLYKVSDLPLVRGSTFTFGETNAGSVSQAGDGNDIYISRFQASSTGYITYLENYMALYSAGSAVVEGVIYSDSSGSPYQLLGVSSPVTLTSTNNSWVDFPNFNVNIVSGDYYWLGYLVPSTNTVGINCMLWSGSAGASQTMTPSGVLSASSAPDYWEESEASSHSHYLSIYANCVSGSGQSSTTLGAISIVSRTSSNVNAFQGVAFDGTYFYTASSTAIYKYSSSWSLVASNTNALSECPSGATEINSLFVYNGLIYAGVWCGSNNYIVVWNAANLSYNTAYELTYSSPWDAGGPQTEGCCYANGYWWVCWDSGVSTTFVSQYSTSWTWMADYNLTYPWYYGNANFQGIRFIGNYLFGNSHELTNQPTMDVYYWTGSGFTPIERIIQPSPWATQGFEINTATQQIYWCERGYGTDESTYSDGNGGSNTVLVTSYQTNPSAPAVPTVSVSPGSATLDVGQSQPFSATPSGGSGSYTGYQWYVNGVVQGGQTASTFNFTPVSSGSYSITVTVTDSSGATSAQSSVATVTVAASPTVSIAPVGPLTMDVGQVQTFTAIASGGSGTINYQWYLDGSAVGSNSASYSYTASGTSHSVTCKVTDSASTPVTSPASNTVTITVNASPTVSVSPSSWTMVAGQSKMFSASASGGSGTYLSYQWYVNGVAQYGQTASTYSFAPVSSGSYLVTVTVTDSSGAVSAPSSPAVVTVSTSPT